MNKNAQYLSIVAGNDFELTAKISSYDVDNSAYTDFDLTGCSQVCLFLVAVTGGRRYKIPVTIDGNILTADIDGSMLNVGVYGLELLFEDAESHSKRSYEPALLKIVRTNAEATYTQADFDSEDDCRLHITVQTNASFITIGAPTADAQIDATSYNAVSNAVVTEAINNLQSQIDSIGSEILDPASVYTKSEVESLIDEMIDPQEMADYVNNAVSYYTTTEQFDSSYNSLSERISAIEDNPTDVSNLVSYNYLSEQSYLQASALDGLATQAYVEEKVSAIDVTDQLTDYVRKEDLNNAGYLQSDALDGLATESYVVNKINAIAPTDISGLVSYEFLTAQAYLQADDISDVVRDSDLAGAGYITVQDVSAMGYASTQFVTEQIAAIPQPDLSAYVTETELTNTLSSYAQLADLISNERVVSTALNSLADRIETVEGDYVSDTELDEALLPYATEAYVVEKIDSIAPADLNEYVSKNYLSQQGYLTAGDVAEMGYLTTQDVSSMGYATTEYVTQQITADLSGYVSKSELSAASYLQSDALNGYATESYVAEKIDSIAPADLTEYVSKTFLSQQSYLQADDISDVVRDSDLTTAGYITTQDVSAMGYATTQYVTTYVNEQITADLSSYVSKSDLNAAGYITANDVSSMGYLTESDLSDYVTDSDLVNAGYVTTTALDTALSSYAKVSYIEDNEQVISTALNTLSDRIGLVENDYVSDDDLDDALADFATKSYVDEKISGITPTDLSSYVSKAELTAAGYINESDVAQMGYITESDVVQMGYITANDVSAMGYLTESDLSDYVTDTDLAGAGYVTATELSSAGYVTATELSSAGYVTNTELTSAGYVTATELTSAGYVTNTELTSAGYVTATELSSASYVTNTALNTALSSYTTKADVPYKFVVMSYADYTALPTKDANTFYMIPE